MKNNYLFSEKFRKPGLVLLLIGIALGLYALFINYEPQWAEVKVFAIFNHKLLSISPDAPNFSFIKNNIIDELASILCILGGLWYGFSKEDNEDEFISKLRLDSLLIAIRVHYFLLIIAILFIYGTSFFQVMVYTMFTPLIIFIIRFRYVLYQSQKSAE